MYVAISVLLMCFTAALLNAQNVVQYTPDWKGLARRIVQQMDLQTGEKVLLLAHPGRFEELIPHLRYAVSRTGAVDLGCLDVLSTPYAAEWDVSALLRVAPEQRSSLKEFLGAVDVTVKLPGARGPAPAYLAIQDLLQEGRGRAVHFHWDGAFPVKGQSLPPPTHIDRLYQKAMLETDYPAIASVQKRFEEALRQHEVRVTTPHGTDIRFRIGDRPVSRQDGDASAARAAVARTIIDREVELPCGAVRVAPLEETVNGTIVFPQSSWNGLTVEELELRFVRGRVVDFRAKSGREAVEAEFRAAGAEGTSFRGFGLGFNPLLSVPQRSAWIPYYGYGAGVVRLSLGYNAEIGGAVQGDYVRWNFLVDATVRVGNETWVDGGKLTVPGL